MLDGSTEPVQPAAAPSAVFAATGPVQIGAPSWYSAEKTGGVLLGPQRTLGVLPASRFNLVRLRRDSSKSRSPFLFLLALVADVPNGGIRR